MFGGGYDPSPWVGARVSENGRHVLFDVQHGWARNDVFVQDLAAPGPSTIVTDLERTSAPLRAATS